MGSSQGELAHERKIEHGADDSIDDPFFGFLIQVFGLENLEDGIPLGRHQFHGVVGILHVRIPAAPPQLVGIVRIVHAGSRTARGRLACTFRTFFLPRAPLPHDQYSQNHPSKNR